MQVLPHLRPAGMPPSSQAAAVAAPANPLMQLSSTAMPAGSLGPSTAVPPALGMPAAGMPPALPALPLAAAPELEQAASPTEDAPAVVANMSMEPQSAAATAASPEEVATLAAIAPAPMEPHTAAAPVEPPKETASLVFASAAPPAVHPAATAAVVPDAETKSKAPGEQEDAPDSERPVQSSQQDEAADPAQEGAVPAGSQQAEAEWVDKPASQPPEQAVALEDVGPAHQVPSPPAEAAQPPQAEGTAGVEGVKAVSSGEPQLVPPALQTPLPASKAGPGASMPVDVPVQFLRRPSPSKAQPGQATPTLSRQPSSAGAPEGAASSLSALLSGSSGPHTSGAPTLLLAKVEHPILTNDP